MSYPHSMLQCLLKSCVFCISGCPQCLAGHSSCVCSKRFRSLKWWLAGWFGIRRIIFHVILAKKSEPRFSRTCKVGSGGSFRAWWSQVPSFPEVPNQISQITTFQDVFNHFQKLDHESSPLTLQNLMSCQSISCVEYVGNWCQTFDFHLSNHLSFSVIVSGEWREQSQSNRH